MPKGKVKRKRRGGHPTKGTAKLKQIVAKAKELRTKDGNRKQWKQYISEASKKV